MYKVELKAPPRNLRRWLDGYAYRKDDEVRHVAPLWRPDLPKIDDEIELSFRDLIELRFVRAFLSQGIGLKAVRNCLDYARLCIQTDRPFSSGRFRTDGRTIFLESLEAAGEPKLLDLKKKQYVFKQVVEQSFKDLDLEGDIVARWRPYRGKDTIVVDPTRSFGQPVAAVSGFGSGQSREVARAKLGFAERVRPCRCGVHPILPSKGDQRDLKAVTCICEAKHNCYPAPRATVPDTPSRKTLSQEGPRVWSCQNIAQKGLDLIETTRGCARVAGYVGDMARQFPQVPADKRVLFDPDHALDWSSACRSSRKVRASMVKSAISVTDSHWSVGT